MENVFLGSLGPCFDQIRPADSLPEIFEDLNITSKRYCLPYPRAHWTIRPNDPRCTKRDHDTTNLCVSEDGTWISCGTESVYSLYPEEKVQPNPFLQSLNDGCYSSCQGFYVINKIGAFRKRLATLPAWMFFHSASTTCYKEVGNRVWYFRGNCRRDVMFEFAQKYR